MARFIEPERIASQDDGFAEHLVLSALGRILADGLKEAPHQALSARMIELLGRLDDVPCRAAGRPSVR